MKEREKEIKIKYKYDSNQTRLPLYRISKESHHIKKMSTQFESLIKDPFYQFKDK